MVHKKSGIELERLEREIDNTQIIMLAGGKGKRLGNIDRPKALLEIAGETLLDYSIYLFRDCGFLDFRLLLGYLHEQIEKYVGDGSRYGIKVKYSIDPEDVENVGKGKSLKYALQNETIDKSKRGIIKFPDDIILERPIPIRALIQRLQSRETLGTIATAVFVPGTTYSYGVADIDESSGLVTSFIEKPFIKKWTSIGMYILDPEVYPIIEDLIDLSYPGPLEFEKIVIPYLASEKKLDSMILRPSEMWLSVNTQKEYEKAEKILSELKSKGKFR